MKKSKLKDRLNKSFKDKDKGSTGKPALDFRKVGDVKYYSPKEGKNKIDIIPYVIKTKNHPLVKSKDMEVGDLDYLLDVFVHRRIGPSQTDVLCPKMNFGKACPICEQREKYKQEGKKKEADSFKPTRMVYYNVINRKGEELNSEILVFSVSHYLFERELIDAARNDSDDGEIVDFPDIEEGKTIKFRGSKESFEGNDYLKYKDFGFLDREDPLDDDLIKEAISFDEIMILYSYEEIEKILYGEDEEEEEEKPKPKKHSDEEEEEEKPKPKKHSDEEEEEEKPKPKKHSDEEEEEEEKPKSKKHSDEEEEEEKPKSKKQESKEKECPHGHIYGEDNDGFEDCDNCSVWGKCRVTSKKLKELKKEK